MKTSRKQILQSGGEKSMSSPEGSPASLFLVPDRERERKMTATSGRKCYERYGRFSPIGLLVKTLLESSRWYNPAVKLRWDVKNLCSERLTEKEYCIGRNTSSKQCVTTLNVKDIPSNRLLFRLVPSERRTEGIVSSLLREEYKTITTTSGVDILVDSEDFPFLNQWKWKINNSGYVYRTIRAKEDGKKWKTILMHRLICCPKENEEVDHINRCKTDNRKQNLRILAHWGNLHNRKKGSGVRKPKGRNKWHAIIYVNRKRIHLGFFDTKEEAMNARLNAERKLLPTVQMQGLKVCNENGKKTFYPVELLPTPTAIDGGTGRINKSLSPNAKERPTLALSAKMGLLPTPMASDIHHAKRVKDLKNAGAKTMASRRNGSNRPNGLMDFHGMLPTPTASCHNPGTAKDRKDGSPRTSELNHLCARLIGKTSLLNPLFVAEMMGFPPDWTVLPFQSGGRNR